MREEILGAIKEMESAVMEIKRDRLLAALELAQVTGAWSPGNNTLSLTHRLYGKRCCLGL